MKIPVVRAVVYLISEPVLRKELRFNLRTTLPISLFFLGKYNSESTILHSHIEPSLPFRREDREKNTYC